MKYLLALIVYDVGVTTWLISTTAGPHSFWDIFFCAVGLIMLPAVFLWPIVLLIGYIAMILGAIDLANNVAKIARNKANE